MTRLLTALEVSTRSALNRAAHGVRTVTLLNGRAERQPVGEDGLTVKGKRLGRPKNHKPKPPTEHEEAVALVQWWDSYATTIGLDPRLLAAIPNGGQRHPAVAAKMKVEGVRAGYPDYFLAVPRCFDARLLAGWNHGLYLELKALNGNIQDSQREYAALLEAQGYSHSFCYGAEAAKAVIQAYLNNT